MTLSIEVQHDSIECHYADFRYAECLNYLNVMMSIVMLNIVMLSVVRLNVVMLSVVAPSLRGFFILYLLLCWVSLS